MITAKDVQGGGKTQPRMKRLILGSGAGKKKLGGGGDVLPKGRRIDVQDRRARCKRKRFNRQGKARTGNERGRASPRKKKKRKPRGEFGPCRTRNGTDRLKL